MVPDMHPYYSDQLSTWRQYAGGGEQAPQSPGDPGAPDEQLATHLRQLHSQCLQTLQARDRYYAAAQAYLGADGRTADQQAFTEHAGAASLKAFSQSSAHYLQLAIMRSVQTQREEARARPVIMHAPPPPQSLLARLVGR